jgi:hypothetical protein
VRQGNVVLLTRSDGQLLSVHAADIDWKATAAAGNTTRAPAKEGRSQAPPEAAGPGAPTGRIKGVSADRCRRGARRGGGAGER